ncbi:replication initiator protein A [Enterococcus gallinarum]|uniref:replication initiator protein A n=1 Tax=Enterococcus gallinarum TaxID=1353 RepID=UPI0029548805|nr:replication initiator protein A [Enterococcus gallinarum]MDV7786501.1 replication initiator protein A [Enterococcus gallinarum]
MKYENVYTVAEENSHRFYQLPKELFINESYKGLSISAKMIYSFLLDRKELSRTNNWIDEYGQVFLLFTRKHVGEMLNLSDKPVTNAFKELIKADLIKEERQGLNKPNKIYVCKINYGIGESPIQESEYIRPNDTEINNTEKNNNSSSRENSFSEKKEPTITYFIHDYKSLLNGLDVLDDEAERVINVIVGYSEKYRDTLQSFHPRISKEQLSKIESMIRYMDYLETWDWRELIERYFEEENYGDGNINRFFAGTEEAGVIAGMIL